MQDNDRTNDLENSNLTFEEAMKELEKIATYLEKGDGTLDDSLAAYKRGLDLKKICEAQLNEAKNMMEKIYAESITQNEVK